MNRMVTCVDCGKVLRQDDAFTRVRIGTVVGYTATQWLCDGCRFPGEVAVREPAHGSYLSDSSIVERSDWDREDDEDGTYEGEW